MAYNLSSDIDDISLNSISNIKSSSEEFLGNIYQYQQLIFQKSDSITSDILLIRNNFFKTYN
jgi:hypothetical protein